MDDHAVSKFIEQPESDEAKEASKEPRDPEITRIEALLEIAAQQLRDLEQNIQVNSDTWTRLSATRHALINETPELQKPFAIECTECVNAAILLIQTDLDSLQASKAIKQTYKQIQETLAHANGLLQEISKIKGVDKDHPEYELFKQGLDIPIKAWEDFIKRLGIMLLAMG